MAFPRVKRVMAVVVVIVVVVLVAASRIKRIARSSSSNGEELSHADRIHLERTLVESLVCSSSSPSSFAALHSSAAMDSVKEVVEIPQRFVKEGTQVGSSQRAARSLDCADCAAAVCKPLRQARSKG